MKFDITPIEARGGMLFKREDYFKPFYFSPVNGSKLRQCIMLVEKNKDKISQGIITGTSIHSPQAAITASVARYYNVPCTICFGGTTDSNLTKNAYPNLCKRLGARTEIISKSGRTSILQSKIDKRVLETGEYNIRYGFDLRNNLDVFIQSVGQQCQNIPKRIENIVITVGSSITLLGLLYGLYKYNKRVDNIYAIGCAPNRINKIDEYLEMMNQRFGTRICRNNVKYVDAFNLYKGFKYEDEHKQQYCGITFHPRYEAKTFLWLKNHRELMNKNTLMWITGAEIINH